MHCSKHYIAIEPGLNIQEMLGSKEMNLSNFAHAMDISKEDVCLLLSGKIEIDTGLATKLESVLGPSKTFWLNLESQYQENLRKVAEDVA